MSRLSSFSAALVASLVVTAPAGLATMKVAHATTPRPPVRRAPSTFVPDLVVLGDEDAVLARAEPPPPEAPPPVVHHAAPPPSAEPLLRARLARQLETLAMCRRSDGPEGRGAAEVVYAPDGSARVTVAAPYAGTAAGACIARRLAGAAQPFDGAAVTLRVPFEL